MLKRKRQLTERFQRLKRELELAKLAGVERILRQYPSNQLVDASELKICKLLCIHLLALAALFDLRFAVVFVRLIHP